MKAILCKSCFSYFGQCSQMDDNIVNAANDVLEEMHSEQNKRDLQLRDEIQELKVSMEFIKSQLSIANQKLSELVL